jgi:hypothetical protein
MKVVSVGTQIVHLALLQEFRDFLHSGIIFLVTSTLSGLRADETIVGIQFAHANSALESVGSGVRGNDVGAKGFRRWRSGCIVR